MSFSTDRSTPADKNWQSVANILCEHGIDVIIVGGQAVNFWGQSFSIQEEQPFTSIDIDIILDQGLNELETILDGTLKKSNNPIGALLGTFEFENDFRMDILLPDKVMGLSKPETVYLKKNAKSFQGLKFRVADPISLLKSKLGNIENLDQKARQDVKHARILILVIRAMFKEMINLGKSKEDSRVIINETKRYLKIEKKAARRNSLRKIERKLEDAIPFSKFEEAKCEKLKLFYKSNLLHLILTEDS